MRALLVSVVLVSSGCFYGKLVDAYVSALGLSGQPAPAAPAEPQATVEPAPEPQAVEPAAPAPAPPPAVVYAPTYVHSTSHSNVVSNVTSTTTYVNAAPAGPPAWIALYPAARGANVTLCKRFSGTRDNAGACSVECRQQSQFGPGSCSCMDQEACPPGTRIVP